MHSGVFTISLDFELHWGVFDKRNREKRKQIYENTIQLIPQLLDLFAEFEIGVTWATVGSLFCKNEEEWRASFPALLPNYALEKYSPYKFADANGIGDATGYAHFAPDLVKRIAAYNGQELATHTFSHYYCLEKGQTKDAFAADLAVVQKLATDLVGKPLQSLVFPRNQYNHDYLNICEANGITAIRSNPAVWFWSGIGNDDTSLLRRLFRTGDIFVATGKRMSYPAESIQKKAGEPLSIPASRLLRQHDPKYRFLNRLRVKRIEDELSLAAAHQEYYHLWWHPENFGATPSACMAELHEILNHYKMLKEKLGMQSMTMHQIQNQFSQAGVNNPVH